MEGGPFTDDMVRHCLKVVQTQHGIIEYAEAMAQILAEAGRASEKALGDPAEYAVRKWSDVIRDRAIQIVAADPSSRMNKKKEEFRKLLERPLLGDYVIEKKDEHGRS